MPRYKNGRRTLMSWRTPEYKLAVALAHFFFVGGRRHGGQLKILVEGSLPDASEAILGKRITWDELCADAQQRFGAEITPHRLLQRADKSARYSEHTEYREAVREHFTAEVVE